MWGPKSEVICLLWPQRGSLSLLRLEEEGFKLNIGETWRLLGLKMGQTRDIGGWG